MSLNPHNQLLPLWKKVIFVDWNGVLSKDRFWNSILLNEKHPLQNQLDKISNDLFYTKHPDLNYWMRGEISTKNLINNFKISLNDKRFQDIENYLMKILIKDCIKMSLDQNVLDILKTVSEDSFIVLATDNMDFFYELLIKKSRHKKFQEKNKESIPLFPIAKSMFDSVLCSSELGVLKSENPNQFFGVWLEQNQLKFEDAFLIDDSSKNCKGFQKQGGSFYHINNNETDPTNGLKSSLNKWVNL